MLPAAPLQVTVEIALGERCFRLSRRIELPPALDFAGPLPLEGEREGQVSFALPDGTPIAARARLRFDPEHPQRGARAELVALPPAALAAIQRYIEQRQEEP